MKSCSEKFLIFGGTGFQPVPAQIEICGCQFFVRSTHHQCKLAAGRDARPTGSLHALRIGRSPMHDLSLYY